MGMFDSIYAPCPKCGEESEFQSKGGDCFLECYNLVDVPYDVLLDANRHSPNTCEKCGTKYFINWDDKSAWTEEYIEDKEDK